MKKIKFFIIIGMICSHLPSCAQSESGGSSYQERIRKRWNKSLVNDPAYKFNKNANHLLKETIDGMPPGRALDVAMGQGRNTLYLASQGWEVSGFDLADEAVAYAEKIAEENHLSISTSIADFESYDYGINQWDLITWIYGGCLEVDQIADRIRTALKPGGIFLFEFLPGCRSGHEQARLWM